MDYKMNNFIRIVCLSYIPLLFSFLFADSAIIFESTHHRPPTVREIDSRGVSGNFRYFEFQLTSPHLLIAWDRHTNRMVINVLNLS